MTLKGSGKSFRKDNRRSELDWEVKELAIRELDLRSCLEHCGVHFNGQGFAHCPFHNERTASFRVRGRFWKCFGCGETGELTKFYRKKFGLSYADAIESICRDFGINTAGPTIKDLERLDFLRLERYNAYRQYQNLLNILDIKTALYWFAYDALEYVVQFCGGKSIDNEQYVTAHYALMSAQKALEQAEFDCAQYAKDNPAALHKPQKRDAVPQKGSLPPAPKWRVNSTLW